MFDVGRYRLDPQVAHSALPSKILDAESDSKLAEAKKTVANLFAVSFGTKAPALV
jgi:hypothetical protein